MKASRRITTKFALSCAVLALAAAPSLNIAQPAFATQNCELADFSGVADYYADVFHGRRTASGQVHDKHKLTAAHRTLPFGTKVKLVNRRNKRSCVVVINDRGPFSKNRVIDVSQAAARELGLFGGARMIDAYILDAP